ncbi:uncharacterized protein [Primulina huaijiensis]|uniref:uncharacterized protein isoform X1 n=1 Tax=Primulina huaijiensis TaxID=1492673 RepID=UPI003CC6FD9F
MSNSDSFLILETEKAGNIGDKIVNATKPCPGSMAQRQLGDISNLPRKPRPKVQAEKPQPVQTTTNKHIDQLQKENLALKKMLVQRNEIIEKSGIDLKMLRANVLKLQEQNHQLAFSNSQFLAELNSGKDRLKALQHELGCKNGLFKALKLKLEEEKRTNRCQNADPECLQAKLRKFREEEVSSKEGEEHEQPHSTKRRLQSNSSASSEEVQCDGKAENKRTIVRRQSTRFKKAESKPIENLNDEDNTNFSKLASPDNQDLEDGPIFVNESLKHEGKECISDLQYDSQELERSNQCRPSRVAARKVQSYKEIPLNVKMRRPE